MSQLKHEFSNQNLSYKTIPYPFKKRLRYQFFGLRVIFLIQKKAAEEKADHWTCIKLPFFLKSTFLIVKGHYKA